MSSSISQDVPSFTSIPTASRDVEKHCPIRAMKVATHLKTIDNYFRDFKLERFLNDNQKKVTSRTDH